MPGNDSKKLLDFVSDVAGDRWLKVERELGSGYFVLNTSEAERRQARHDIRSVEAVVVELLRNARDATAHHVFIAFSHAGQLREITVIDDGVGIPTEMKEAIFDARVTSKLDAFIEDVYGIHGRGMALYSIRANVQSAEIMTTGRGRGAAFRLRTDTERLPERKDQSTFPKLKLIDDRPQIVKGPVNVLRVAVEFSLAHPELNLYFGSNAEILATMFSLGRLRLAEIGSPEEQVTPLWLLPGGVSSAMELASVSREVFGLGVSGRNCQRIFSGQIRPAPSIAEQITAACRPAKTKRPAVLPLRDLASMFSGDDMESFSQAIAENFRHLGEKYFLRLDAKPKIRYEPSGITIDLSVASEDSW